MELFGVSIWLFILILFLVVEAVSSALVSIWFCFGALAAWICSIFTDSIGIQITIFFIVSILALIFTRPIIKKLIKSKGETRTNCSLLIGESGVVTEEIDNIRGLGAIKIKGNVWSAISLNDEKITKDTIVIVERIEGVKLIVRKKEEE
ncbi:NfeD family protein [Oceanirhabdus sp. W0125-5]|uniref:NfeD family protein n=1 Tax=Oceanirhabdus sp. W0125-5 TaxID=2999116 RepID=UPI0022F34452|nr:NfeD family protein [Oceanirhabdus sp. W0125-5]WBW98260.1 NfeD family protein [Oceanirhabdus sp. W0125-5]